MREAFRFLHAIGRGYSLAEIVGGKSTESGERVWSGIRGGMRELPFRKKESLEIDARFEDKANKDSFIYTIRFVIQSIDKLSLAHESLTRNGETVFSTLTDTEANMNVVVPAFVKFIHETDRPVLPIVDSRPQSSFLENEFVARVLSPELETKRPPVMELLQGPISNETASLIVTAVENRWSLLHNQTSAILEVFRNLRFFDLDIETMRQTSRPGQFALSENGSNLSAVLYEIYQDPGRKQRVLTWLHELTPMDVESFDFFTDDLGNVRLQLVEADGRKTSVFSASDGTLRFLGILTAMLGPQPASLYFFEELENGIHPARQYLLLQLIEQQARNGKTQVIITTHSSSLLNSVRGETLEHAYLLHRPEGRADATLTRLLDMPDAARLAQAQGLGRLHASGWFENVMSFAEDEKPEAVS